MGQEDPRTGPPPFRSDADNAYIVSRLINQGNVADGPSVPLRVRGEFRVPMVSGLKIVGTPTASFGGTIFTLAWKNPEDRFVSRFNVYVLNLLESNPQPVLVGVAERSPFVARVIADSVTPISFFVQTVMSNGQTLPADRCPTCTAITVAPTISTGNIPNGSITNSKLAGAAQGSLITFDGTTAAVDLAPGTSGFFLKSQGSSSNLLWASLKRTRVIHFAEKPTTIAGALIFDTIDNVFTYQLIDTADTTINTWFRVPDDADITTDIILVLNFAPALAPGATNNKVKLIVTPKINNTGGVATAGDVITLANNTNWASYAGTLNKIAGSSYAIGDFIQLAIKRDTSVANNAAVGFDISSISFKYTSQA